MGVVHALAGCGESCGLQFWYMEIVQFLLVWGLNPFLRLSKCSLCLHDNGWVEVNRTRCLISFTTGVERVYYGEVAGRLNCQSVYGALNLPRLY